MRKEELRKLRKLPATKEMMEKGKAFEEKEERSWDGEIRRVIVPKYDILLRVQNLSHYIKIAVFRPEDMRKDIRTPRYEIFVNPQGGEWITRVLDEEGKEDRWSEAIVGNLKLCGTHCWTYWKNKSIFINRDGRNTLNSLVLDEENGTKGIERLKNWQEEQRKKKIQKQEAREQKPWDADMALIPKITPGFEEWMRKDATDDYFIFYKYDPKGAKTGFCSRCRRTVPINGAKHNKETRCPACKAKAIFRAVSRNQTLTTGDYYGEIIQKIKGGIVIRTYRQTQWYRHTDYQEPQIRTCEIKRTLILNDGTVRRYEWGFYKNKFCRWILDRNYFPGCREYWEPRVKLYKRNFAKLKNHTVLKQSAIDLWGVYPGSAASYLTYEKKHPVIEMLARLGMFRLAGELFRHQLELLDEKETEIAKILKIDKNRLKRLRALNGNKEALMWLQLERIEDTIWSNEMIYELAERHITPWQFGFLPAPIKYTKCYHYLKKQMILSGKSMNQTRITWRDYIDMAEQLKMDTTKDQIARPKDLEQAHEELILLREQGGIEKQAKEIEKDWPKVNPQLPKLQKFEFTDGTYSIVAPKNVADIVKEGTILKHCVHTCDYYFDRISKDESYLFFLRKSAHPDMPWYTLEVEPSGNIRQKRTTGDNQNKDFEDAVEFLKKWQQYFKKQLTKEEKELGEAANRARLENYENLRKNGNRVWHGKLAGQLLADVLEKDFMEAI